MEKILLISSLSLMLLLPIPGISRAGETLSAPHPSRKAVALYRFLQDMKGKRILSGQQDSPWGIDEFAYVKSHTGKQPAIRGMDFIHQGDNQGEIQKAINWWKAGGIPTIMWHWGAPTKGDGYEQSKMQINVDNCFKEGTAEYAAFWAELKMKADLLTTLRDARVPILWRPYHELNGNWFWWGKAGPVAFKKLWITMFNYFVNERGLNNLIWVLCHTSTPDAAWYPGDEYVDIVGADTYNAGNGPQLSIYNGVKAITGDKFPIAYHECGIPPVPDQCLSQGAMWSWWMEWHTDYLTGVDKSYLNTIYNHELVLTLDELPSIATEYNWPDTCQITAVTPRLKIDNGEFQTGNALVSDQGDKVTFSPVASVSGLWSWSGYGTSGNVPEQTVPITGQGSAVVSFTNGCGAVNSLLFYVTEGCIASKITPWMSVGGGVLSQTDTVSITAGQAVRMSPQAPSGGTWRWGGAVSGNMRDITFYPKSTTSATVTHINACGKSSQATFTITVNSPPTPVAPPVVQSAFKIWPSPCSNILWIDSPGITGATPCQISVVDSKGRRVIAEVIHTSRSELNVSQLLPGFYFLTLTSGLQSQTLPFVKSSL